jgi:hypothetical protein
MPYDIGASSIGRPTLDSSSRAKVFGIFQTMLAVEIQARGFATRRFCKVRVPYYIEFIRKRDDVPWDVFDSVIRTAYRRWASLHPEDRPVLAVGRTWRLGPTHAPYMIAYEIPNMARIDEWTAARREDLESSAAIDQGTLSVAEIDAGVYERIGDEMR